MQGSSSKSCDGIVKGYQQKISLAVLEERMHVANAVIQGTEEEASALCNKIHDIVQFTLDTLVSEGSLSIAESDALSQEYTKQNAEMLKNVYDTKKKHLKILSDRKIEKKRSKLAKLREKHELEKEEVF